MTTSHVTVGGGSGSAEIEWEPSSAELYDSTLLAFYDPSITSITLNFETRGFPISFDTAMVNLATISFPNLVSIDEDETYNTEISFSELAGLTSLGFPKLAVIGSGYTLTIQDCTNLSSLDLSALEQVGTLYVSSFALTSLDLSSLVTASSLTIKSGSSLTNIDLSSFVPTNGQSYDFTWNALTADCVNAILARFVANASYVTGTIGLNEGTNAAPTGQGLTDVTTLRGRGVTVAVTE